MSTATQNPTPTPAIPTRPTTRSGELVFTEAELLAVLSQPRLDSREQFEAAYRYLLSEEIGRRVWDFLLYGLGNEPDTWDCYQNTFTRFLQFGKAGSVKPGHLTGLLITVAGGIAKDFKQRKAIHKAKLEELAAKAGQPTEAADDDSPGDTDGTTPEELKTAVYGLPEKYREVVVAKYPEPRGERTVAEAAEVLGLSVSAVKVRLHRAYRLLKRRLAPAAGGTGVAAALGGLSSAAAAAVPPGLVEATLEAGLAAAGFPAPGPPTDWAVG